MCPKLASSKSAVQTHIWQKTKVFLVLHDEHNLRVLELAKQARTLPNQDNPALFHLA